MLYGNPIRAVDYLHEGANILFLPGLRRFVVIPLLINIVVFIAITSILINTYSGILRDAANTSNWWTVLAWLVWIIIGLVVLIIYGYTFNLITTVIAAPFYGVLAEQVEQHLTGEELPHETIVALILRTFQRELLKLWYFISRGLLVLIASAVLFLIPLLGSLASLLISALWAAWCMTVQYTDYAADNHQTSFRRLRQNLRDQPLTSFSFGGLIMLGSMVPILNIFVMPIAVAGATVYWVNEHESALPKN
jgi:CysZ protein